MPLLLGAAVLLVVYLTFSSARYVIHNYQLHQQEQQVRNDLARLQKDNQQLTAVRDYLKSDEYVEDVARRTLGLVKPGETLVIVSGTTPVASTPTPGNLVQRTPEPAWWKSLFGPGGAPVPTPTP
ncbi:MAG TPA: septum formation initiator family protein [Dehalococcoidia bacterium]|nr:septum formation initiator family protein [Dehalococcoidia bacterium]